MASLNIADDAECVVISDEDDDDLAIQTKAAGKSVFDRKIEKKMTQTMYL